MHRALQVIDAAKTLIAAQATSASVYRHRALSLSDDEQELPAITVRIGTDTPVADSGQGSMQFIDSYQELLVDVIAKGDDEDDVIGSLLDLRAAIHEALQADVTLGLAFVTDTAYGGASSPDIPTGGSRLVGSFSTRWVVRYRMNFTDPN